MLSCDDAHAHFDICISLTPSLILFYPSLPYVPLTHTPVVRLDTYSFCCLSLGILLMFVLSQCISLNQLHYSTVHPVSPIGHSKALIHIFISTLSICGLPDAAFRLPIITECITTLLHFTSTAHFHTIMWVRTPKKYLLAIFLKHFGVPLYSPLLTPWKVMACT